LKTIHIIAIAVIGIVLAIVLSFYGDKSYYVTFEQAESMSSGFSSKDFHVVAKLNTEKPMVYDPIKDPNYFEFHAIDSVGVERKVVYKNSKPHDLERTDKIVLIGKAEKDYFLANDILKKCPSKYDKTPEQANSEN